jgi:hypothetical protein
MCAASSLAIAPSVFARAGATAGDSMALMPAAVASRTIAKMRPSFAAVSTTRASRSLARAPLIALGVERVGRRAQVHVQRLERLL